MAHPPYPPPPPIQPPKKGMSTGAKIGLFGCGGCLGVSLLGLVFLLVIGAVASTPDGGDTTVATSPEEADAAADTGGDDTGKEGHPGLGEVVEHGAWEITVHSVTDGVATSDLGMFAEPPSGRWVVVEIEATNTSSGPEYFEASDQVLMDADGSMYERDISASEGISSLDKVNPGGTVSGTLAFDMPEGVEVDHMLVNGEGMFAEGTRVDLD